MLELKDRRDCCGCEACFQACPTQAIKLKKDNDGFFYPHIDHEKCIECNKCNKVCPIVSKISPNLQKEHEVYVAYTLDEDIRKNSSSGGLFSMLANEVLALNGVIYGAAFDENNLVKHIGISSKEDLPKLMGSKYVQSRIGHVFKDIKKILEQGTLVLFSGTACQVAGLLNFLEKKYDNLITIDVLCHGVPSPLLWERYLLELRNKSGEKIQKIEFRNKTTGWKRFSLKITMEKEVLLETLLDNLYMRMFLENICLRPSCYACKYKELDRPSDITLGDCWAIADCAPELDDDKGISVVIAQTEKGKKLLESISNNLKIVRVEADEAIPPLSDSRKSVDIHPEREKFFRWLNKGKSMEELEKLLPITFTRRVKRKIIRSINQRSDLLNRLKL